LKKRCAVHDNIISDIEHKFKLPPISSVANTLKSFPDVEQLRMLKQTLEVADKVSRTAPELNQVLGLIKAIKEIPTDKLVQIGKLLKSQDRVSMMAPELNQVLSLIKVINDIPTEKLAQLEKLLKRLENIIKLAPPEIMSLLKELREE